MSTNNNLPSGGTGTAVDISDEALDEFLDEDSEDGATGEGDEEQADVEAAASEDDPGDEQPGDAEDGEADEDDGDREADDGSAIKLGAKADAIVELDDGTKIPLKELAEGYQRQDDYTRKTQALAGERKHFEANVARAVEQVGIREKELDQAFEMVIDVLSAFTPREPDPSLAYTDPQSFMQMKAMHDAQMRQINQVLDARKASQGKALQASEEQKRQFVAMEAEKVADVFPVARDPVKGKDFWVSMFKTASSLGYSDAELNGMDSRAMIGLARLAQYEAREAARSGKAPVKQGGSSGQSFQPKRPAPVVRKAANGNPALSKSLRSFRETGSATAAERAWAAMDID